MDSAVSTVYAMEPLCMCMLALCGQQVRCCPSTQVVGSWSGSKHTALCELYQRTPVDGQTGLLWCHYTKDHVLHAQVVTATGNILPHCSASVQYIHIVCLSVCYVCMHTC